MRHKSRFLLLLCLTAVMFILWQSGTFSYISLDKIGELQELIRSFGYWAPMVYIVVYILATVFFLPDVPITVLGSIVFGPILGLLWVSIGSTAGATIAFLIGRYTGRAYVAEHFSNKAAYMKLQNGIRDHGWKMVVITRLIPLVPFNAQNYVYGLTDISFSTYVFFTWLCMLPATIAYVFLGGAVAQAHGQGIEPFAYILISLSLLAFLSILGKRLGKKVAVEE